MSTDLLSDIEAFLEETKMHEHRFGLLAVSNGRLVERLRAGKTPGGKRVRVWPETETQVRAFMLAQRKSRDGARPKKMAANPKVAAGAI